MNTKKICEYTLNENKMIVIRTESGNVHSMPKSEWARFKAKYKYGRRKKGKVKI